MNQFVLLHLYELSYAFFRRDLLMLKPPNFLKKKSLLDLVAFWHTVSSYAVDKMKCSHGRVAAKVNKVGLWPLQEADNHKIISKLG